MVVSRKMYYQKVIIKDLWNGFIARKFVIFFIYQTLLKRILGGIQKSEINLLIVMVIWLTGTFMKTIQTVDTSGGCTILQETCFPVRAQWASVVFTPTTESLWGWANLLPPYCPICPPVPSDRSIPCWNMWTQCICGQAARQAPGKTRWKQKVLISVAGQ